MVQPSAKTASGPIAIVALEQNFPRNQRVVVDDFAHRLLPFAARVLVWVTRLDFARNWMLRMTEKSFPVLEAHAFSLDKGTFFIWEAVTQYLTQGGFTITFELLGKAPAGSHLAFTYVCKDFLKGRNVYGQQGLYKRYVRDKIWLFGLEPEGVASFLETYGWLVVEQLGYEELNERYVKPTGRQLAVMAIERIVYAERL